MGVVHVIGLGVTAKDFVPDGGLTIGVNDVKGCNHQVCVDKMAVFSEYRLEAIKTTSNNSGIFFSQLTEWSFMNGFRLIALKNINAHNGRWKYMIPSSNNSPFVACGVAYVYFNATEIKLWGVDFNNHPNIRDRMRDQAVSDYALLNKKLGGIIKPHPDSYLYGRI